MASLRLVTGAAFAALLAAGCTDRACLQWTSQDGPCPSRDAALAFMGGNNACVAGKVTSVDSEGEFDGQACCYDVTEKDDELGDERPLIDCGGSVGAGAPPNPTSGVGAQGPGSFCGNGLCDESCEACPDDCGPCAVEGCGDGFCAGGEEDCTGCPTDCPCVCGDGMCAYLEEDCGTCEADCGKCTGCYVGADNCVGCAELFGRGGLGLVCPIELLCPASTPLLDALLSCECSGCSSECPNACSGLPDGTSECSGCMSCGRELDACLLDTTLPPG